MKKIFSTLLIFCTLYGNDSEEFLQKLSLDSYLKSYPFLRFEGHVDKEQSLYLHNIIQNNPAIKLIGEIGFNAGHSSEVFLASRDDISVISFDIGEHNSVPVAKNYLDSLYTQRHSLILGNSLVTVREYRKTNPNIKFDLIFIDGCHNFETALKDIKNMKALAHENTILIIDDLVPQFEYGKGPSKAWEEAKKYDIINVLEEVSSSNGRKKWGKAKYNFSRKSWRH